jgi:DNA protecting protein DprA
MLTTPAPKRRDLPAARRGKYNAPPNSHSVWLRDLLHSVERGKLTARQLDIFRSSDDSEQAEDLNLYYAGDLNLLKRPCVSIVGTRDPTPKGLARAARLSSELVQRGAVVVSGLARGIDASAQSSAIENGGHTIAVIGTPLSMASPSENAHLQERIWRDHLLISPFVEGRPVYRANFPQRNRVMAALSDATVIVEASDTSGTLHQAAECQRLGRWLFILKSVAEDESLAWPRKFLKYQKVAVLSSTDEIFPSLGI